MTDLAELRRARTLLEWATRGASDLRAQVSGSACACGGDEPDVAVGDAYTERMDERAFSIVRLARDTRRTPSVRAKEVVEKILKTYFPTQRAKIVGIQFDTGVKGLEVQRVGKGATAQGRLFVGTDFLDHTTNQGFARRVLQVLHELRHVDQYRRDEGKYDGPKFRQWREFDAHRLAAMTTELKGTGIVPADTRVGIIDAALGCFNCLKAPGAGLRKQRDDLVKLRNEVYLPRTDNAPQDPPATCICRHLPPKPKQ
jgi:hypothetical protein